jgi:hypothetical protein
MSLASRSRLKGQKAKHRGEDVTRVEHQGQRARLIFGKGTQILPQISRDLSGFTSTRIVSSGGNKYFEFGLRLNGYLDGSPETGWTDADGYFTMVPEYSTDLINWELGKFTTPPTDAITAHGGGSFTYWHRAINLVSSSVITGALIFTSEDSRHNPITSIVLGGVAISLPNYPYSLPSAAAQLQADLIAAGRAGTTVTSTATGFWVVIIPVINLAISGGSIIFFPSYTVINPGGPSTVGSVYASGAFVDVDGIPINPKGFGRLKINPGPRYGAVITQWINNLRTSFNLN